MTTNSGREIILQAIVTCLRAIKQTSQYNTTPKLVSRGEVQAVGELEASQLPVLYVEDGSESVDLQISRLAECTFSVWVHGQIADASHTSAGINALLWDVKRSLQTVNCFNAGSWESGQGQPTIARFAEIEVYRAPKTDLWGFSGRLEIQYQEPLTLTASAA